MTLCLAMGLILAIHGLAQADQIWDRPEYRPSSNLVLGSYGTEWGGSQGYVIAQDFQINLLYQPGVLNSAIDSINDYFLTDPTPTGLNFADNEEYVFNFNLSGGLQVYQHPDTTQGDSGASNIQWTLTGWHQTILAGDIVDLGSNNYFFRVLPAATYRPFPNDPPVNDVEVFSGLMACEVLGYYFHGDLTASLEGGTLEVQHVPLPGALVLLGAGIVRLVAYGRRKRSLA